MGFRSGEGSACGGNVANEEAMGTLSVIAFEQTVLLNSERVGGLNANGFDS